MTKKHIIVLWVLIILSFHLKSQDSIEFKIPKTYGFENIQSDTLGNLIYLSSFFQKLKAQKLFSNQKISILHIGDSHLQADYITHTTRTTLQKHFGNAGRGFITPLKISKSNEPFNYQTASKNNWKSSRCVSYKNTLPIGLGGMTIKTYDSAALIKLKTYNTDSLNYGFNKIILYHQKIDSTYNLLISDTTVENQITKNILPELPYRSTFSLSKITNNIEIKTEKVSNIQSNFVFFGALLENSQSGILYHSIGINGAKYKDYNKASDFCSQTPSLSPDLIIVSLGTNESFQKNYNSDIFYKEIDSLIKKIKLYNPNSPIIVTTPANSFYYHNINLNLPLISETIIKYATENALGIWDLFSITGGKNSAQDWRKNNLLSRDGIHYTKDGYIHQGNLLTNALINAYNKYVSNR